MSIPSRNVKRALAILQRERGGWLGGIEALRRFTKKIIVSVNRQSAPIQGQSQVLPLQKLYSLKLRAEVNITHLVSLAEIRPTGYESFDDASVAPIRSN